MKRNNGDYNNDKRADGPEEKGDAYNDVQDNEGGDNGDDGDGDDDDNNKRRWQM